MTTPERSRKSATACRSRANESARLKAKLCAACARRGGADGCVRSFRKTDFPLLFPSVRQTFGAYERALFFIPSSNSISLQARLPDAGDKIPSRWWNVDFFTWLAPPHSYFIQR